MSVVFLDTRNQKDGFVETALTKLGYKCLRTKLPFGDVALNENTLNCVDLKSCGGGLIELASNFCSKDHGRVRNEIVNCLSAGGEITFLCFEPGICSVEDIPDWKVPTFKNDGFITKYRVGDKWLTKKQLLAYPAGTVKPNAIADFKTHSKGEPMTKVSPLTLYKTIKTITTPDRYAEGKTVRFEFTDKEHCGEKIIEILTRKP